MRLKSCRAIRDRHTEAPISPTELCTPLRQHNHPLFANGGRSGSLASWKVEMDSMPFYSDSLTSSAALT